MSFFDRAVGIDLGTTNSEVALLDPSERDLLVFHDRFNRRTIPSAIAYDPKREEIVVGRAARARRGKEPAPIESIKRKMGQAVTVACGPHELRPEEVSAKILRHLASSMLAFVEAKAPEGVDVRLTRAVITVPAYFDAPQVEATRRAAELAGLEPIGIIQEPTAAAIYQTWRQRLGDGNFLVYDFGGGTFDVSVLRCLSGEYQVVALDGDNYLGGDDFDRRFAEHLRRRLVANGYRLDLNVAGDEGDRARFGRLVHLAQEIKESLSTRDVVHISQQGIVEDQDGESVDFEAEIGRAEYEAVVAELVETTIAACRRALAMAEEKAKVGLADIDHVILVGGSTRVPLVVKRVTDELCGPSKADAPLQDEVDTCVALGAAIHAAQVGGLHLGQDRAHVAITSPLVSKQSPMKLAFRVRDAPPATKEVALRAVEGTSVARTPFAEGDEVHRLAVPLGEEPDQSYAFEFLGVDDEVLATFPCTLHRGDVKPRASALSRPSVVAKDIAIEVMKAGRRDRRVLLPRGAGLPVKAEQTFFTADQSGAVVLRMLQGRTPIKTLALQVPSDLPVGTKVELSVKCDEAMRLEAKAVVAGQELWATVEPPEAPRFDPQGDVEGLLESAERLQRELWGHQGEYFRREADGLTAAIREVVSTDPDKLSVLCGRLNHLIDEFRPDPTAGGLAPPLGHFEYELDSLRRLVYRTPGTLIGMDRSQWEARIEDIDQRAQRAYQATDAIGWRRVVNEVQALRETAQQEEFTTLRTDDPAYVSRRLTNVQLRAADVRRRLQDFVPSAAEDVAALQGAERDRLLASIESDVLARVQGLEIERGIDEARRTIEAASAELERIETALERIPSLGVVTEHGGSP